MCFPLYPSETDRFNKRHYQIQTSRSIPVNQLLSFESACYYDISEFNKVNSVSIGLKSIALLIGLHHALSV